MHWWKVPGRICYGKGKKATNTCASSAKAAATTEDAIAKFNRPSGLRVLASPNEFSLGQRSRRL